MELLFERLNSTNYNTWKEDVRVLLMDRNSRRIITGQEVKPDDGASAKEKQNFESRWDRAYSTIYLSIEKEYRNLISNTCDPIVAWKKFQDHFQPHTRACVIGLLDEFFNCRILEEEEIGLYAARLRTMVFQLRDAGHPLDDLYQAFQLIRYLPESYQDNLVALHFKNDQARRKFVEWAQNEIAVVPDFHKRILFSDEAHFWLNGYVNKQNCRIWSEANPQVYVETPLHPEKLTVWCALWAGGILLQKR
ncbi:retrovirus-related Pol polyprotein from transposon TNT 1-94 [Trichonephila clavipes]|nr:retrovirus-related Pol polyprotein from transposon TNT 1-94 [Trichonephila clavipes]